MTTQMVDPLTTLLFIIALVLFGLAVVYRARVLATMRAAGGAIGGVAGGNLGDFIGKHGWALFSIAVALIAFAMWGLGFRQHLFFLVAITLLVVAIYRFTQGSVFTGIMLLAAAVLIAFVAWAPNWGVIENKAEKYNAWISGTSTPSAAEAAERCGPEHFVEGRGTYSNPVVLERDLACTHGISKTPGIPVQIRFNDEPWQQWVVDNAMPRASSVVRTIAVRPIRVDDTVYVQVIFPERR